ncbi:uncharacterized protein BXZ73DRAFT_103917 [Epithele typhae]|uniref:uncharacterized protein n=1 Tax=Epithele typhae TaxID=378194 RepID=UPI002008496F|nr:uncharacterized protein BXZ73DRAFT_103917 [Epithele typhae]KAH9923119.1 hypothetical protein BXZ73DRAFT_103917 [Epithele typhae]
MYAGCVQKIGLFFSPLLPRPSIWTELDALLTKDDPILPRLHWVALIHQYTYGESWKAESGLLALLSPRLRWARIDGAYDDKDWDTLVANHLLAHCPNLEGATIANTEWMALLSNHHSLEMLHVHGDDPRTIYLACMANWPALRSLTFNTGSLSRSGLPNLVSLPFLQNLEINVEPHGCHLSAPPPSRLSASLPSLRSLSYTLYDGGYAEDLSVPLDAIGAAYVHLTELTLIVRSLWSSLIIHLSDILTPLAPLQRLRVVNITIKGEYMSYNAHDLRRIPVVWPALVELRIAAGLYAQGSDDDVAPLCVLPDLTRALPELRVLHLPQMTFTAGALDVVGAGTGPHRAVYDLRLGLVKVRGWREDSWEEDAKREVRTFLGALFPNAGHRVEVQMNFVQW